MPRVVVLSSAVVVLLSLTVFGADGTLPSPVQVPGAPPPLPSGRSLDREAAPGPGHAHGACADHDHSHESAIDKATGSIGANGGEPIKHPGKTIELAYDERTDSIIIYFPDGSAMRRRLSELPAPGPRLPFRDTGRPDAGAGGGFTCDGANCRFAIERRDGGRAVESPFRPSWGCPSPGYGGQGGAGCCGNNTNSLGPHSYRYAPYGGYYRQ